MWALLCQTQTWHNLSWAQEERLQFNQKVCGLSAERGVGSRKCLWGMDKEDVVHIYNGILLSYKKE